MNQHNAFMLRALDLARKRDGFTNPNPSVGAVIVKNGKVVGEGFHEKVGSPHAEIAAIRQAGRLAIGATMYVTLEPCNHHGQTPPCTEAIINADIRELYYAVEDPNTEVVGKGHHRLKEAGIRVHAGLYREEAEYLNRFFLYYSQTRKPYVIAKFACSLDGRIATHRGDSHWITGELARLRSHTLRHQVDAILVGANTIIRDDPQLTTRIAQQKVSHPLRIILDSTGRVPLTARIFQEQLPGQTLVVTTKGMSAVHQMKLEKLGVHILVVPASLTGQVSIKAMLETLGQRCITSLMVEGGAQVLGSFRDEGCVNEVWAFLAPIIIGGGEAPGAVGGIGADTLVKANRLHSVEMENLGDDILIRGYTKPLNNQIRS